MVDTARLLEIVERLRVQQSDDALVEVKACGDRLSSDIWETVSAFANTSGGLIICGLDEKAGFHPAEGFDFERTRDQFVTGIGDGGQQALVIPTPRYELSRGVVDGRHVMLVEVKELEIVEKPCYIRARGIQGGSYKRVDDKDIKLSPTELYEMQNVLLPSDADGEIVPEATLDDLDDDTLTRVIENRRRRSPRMMKGADTRKQQLERLNVINKAGAVRLAGLLAAGLYPQQYYPKLVVDVAVHAGAEKAQPNAPRFEDREICDGSLSECVEEALSAIGRNLRKASYIEGAGRREEWEVPEEVLREAVANALIHREYSAFFRGQSVTVDIYPDRIEITNPGGLWGGKTIENLADGVSRCRNAKLMSLMGAVPLVHAEGSVAESQGSGIISMIREMRSRALDSPRFVAKPDMFKVILARHGAEIGANRSWLSAHAGRLLSREEETLFMALLEEGGVGSVASLRKKLGWDSDDIRRICRKLIADGLLEELAEDSFKVVELPEGENVDKLESVVPAGGKRSVREVKDALVNAMEQGKVYRAHTLAELTGEPISRIRYILPQLIEAGVLEATAGQHSRHRAYRLR